MTSALVIICGSAFAIAALVVVYIALFRDRSRGRLRCPCCWYGMTSLGSPRCPECGYSARQPSELKHTRRRWWLFALGLALLLLGQSLLLPALTIRGLSTVGIRDPFDYKKLNKQ